VERSRAAAFQFDLCRSRLRRQRARTSITAATGNVTRRPGDLSRRGGRTRCGARSDGSGDAKSYYESLQLRGERRFRMDFALAAYTWAHNIDV
jgi:hypothetical protein